MGNSLSLSSLCLERGSVYDYLFFDRKDLRVAIECSFR